MVSPACPFCGSSALSSMIFISSIVFDISGLKFVMSDVSVSNSICESCRVLLAFIYSIDCLSFIVVSSYGYSLCVV